MKKFENFVQNDKKELEKLPYIKDFEGKLKIIGVNFDKFTNLKGLNHRFWTDLNYNSLIRLFLVSWIDKYTGSDKTLLSIKEELLKNKNRNMDIVQYLAKIPTNRTIMNKYISPVIGIFIKDCYVEDITIMKAIIDNKDKLFTEKNILLWYNEIKGINVYSKKAEKEVIKMFNDFNLLYGEVVAASPKEDLLGVDAYCGNIAIQIKRTGEKCNVIWYWDQKTINNKIKYYYLEIDDLNLDLKEYDSYTDGKLIYDFLVLYDVKGKKLYKIDSKSINKISREKNKILIKMWIKDMNFFEKNFQIIDIPVKN